MDYPNMVIGNRDDHILKLSATNERLYDLFLENIDRRISHKEIAEHLGIHPVSHAGQYVHRLREILEHERIGTITNRHTTGYMLGRLNGSS